MECEREIKWSLFIVADVLIKLVRESENFEKDVLEYISNSVKDTNIGLQKISEYMKDNFGKLDNNSQIVLNLLLMIFEQIQEMNIRSSESLDIIVVGRKFEKNKKQDYVKNWQSRLFLHVDNEEKPLTLEDAFIKPNYEIYKSISRIGFSNNDELDQIIEKFVKYDGTSTMLLTGVPGIGKSSIISWIANKYEDDNEVIILRFRDWECEELECGLLKAICNTLNCEKNDLEYKTLVLDGFDEMKPLNNRNKILKSFFSDIKDYKHFKCIITSRPAYIEINNFQNAFKVMEFDIQKIELFYEIIKGEKLSDRKKIEQNLEVLGIPVILYMAIMSGIDISENPTKPEIYNCIFAKEGGIFDKFSFDGTEYDIGSQILRDAENVKKYLKFLQEVAFKMFEKGEINLSKEECHIPKLEINKVTVSVLEFPIKHLFEEIIIKIEFIHKSIYEYFVAEYFVENINEITNKSVEEIASVLGFIFKGNDLSDEILEFLRYKINEKMNDKFNIVYESFQLMLRDGMLYNTKQYYKDQMNCEMNVFSNMLDLLHLWEWDALKFNSSIRKYMIDGKKYKLNLAKIDLRDIDLEGVDLAEANLRNANLDWVILTDANLRNANLEGVDLSKVNLSNANLRGIDLTKVNLEGVELSNVILDKGQAQYLYKSCHVKDLQDTQVFINTKTVSYDQYYKNHLSKFRFFRNIYKAFEFWVK